MSTLKVSNVVPKDGETMNLGESGSDTVVPVGSTITNNGTAIGFGGSGGPSASRIYTTSGTWTKPDNVSTIMVEVQGSGGGGGGLTNTYASGGGGGGGYARKLIDVSSISSATITVGSGGSGGSPGTTGSNGGSSSWSDGTNTIISTGGIGAVGISSNTYGDGGAGGTSSDGDFNLEGSKGGNGIYNGGWGGESFLSNTTSRGNNSGPSSNGLLYGCGGTGCSGAASSGGSGSDGVIIVTEFSEAGASGSGGGGSSSSGNILQVVQATKEDTFTTTSESFVDITGLSLTITPSNSSSKVLINTTIGVAAGNLSHIQVRRDGVDVAPGITPPAGYASAFSSSIANDANIIESLNINFLDEPNTASPVVYTVAIKCRQSSSMTAINRTVNDSTSTNLGIRSKSYIIAMEVAG